MPLQTLVSENALRAVDRAAAAGNQKAREMVTYFVGQSKDEGESWRMFDVSYNSVANMIYIFPEVITDLPIKQPLILSQDEEEKLAQQQTAAAGQGAKKSKK